MEDQIGLAATFGNILVQLVLFQGISEGIIKEGSLQISFQMGNILNYVQIPSEHVSETNLKSLEIL